MYPAARVVLLLFFIGLSPACSQLAMENDVSAEFTAEGLYPVRNSGFALAFARRDADLSTYRVLDVQALDVSHIEIPQTFVPGTSRRDWEMTPERESALQAGRLDECNGLGFFLLRPCG